MDFLTFISKLVEALAWPTVVVSVLLSIRKELPTIARSLRKFKFKGVEMEFAEAVQAAAAETNAVLPPATHHAELLSADEGEVAARLAQIGEWSPRAAIIEAWMRVEAAAVKLLDKGDVRERSSSERRSLPQLQKVLMNRGYLTPPQVMALESLHRLRNEAVHNPSASLTPEAVAEYIDSALAMAGYLEDMAQKPPSS